MSSSDSNNQNPSTQQFRVQQQSRKKSNFAIAVLVILGCHVVLLGGLLILGCKPEPAEKPVPPETSITETNLTSVAEAVTNDMEQEPGLMYHESSLTNLPPIPGSETNLQRTDSLGGGGPSKLQQLGAETQTIVPPSILPGTNNVVAPATTNTVYVVAQGDNFSRIAGKFGVTVDAISQANPDANSNHLQIGQELIIPAPTATAASTTSATKGSSVAKKMAPGTSEIDSATGKTIYAVASGDNLTKIAKKFGVTIKGLKEENRLAGDRIKVGQKLTIPSKAATSATTSSTNVVLKQLPQSGTVPSSVGTTTPTERIPSAAEITNRATVTGL